MQLPVNPMDPETQYRLAESYYETKQYDMALKHATQAEDLGIHHGFDIYD